MLNHCDSMMLQENMPYGMVGRSQQHNQISMQFLLAAYKAGDSTLAAKVSRSLKKDMQQQMVYYQSLSDNKRDNLSFEEERNENLLKNLMAWEQQFKKQGPATETRVPINTQPVQTDSAKP